jgi:Fur family ferric uptake transcriptional regulator
MTQNRMTRQKQLILDIALAHHDHPTADQIYAEVRAKDGKISRGTVYRDLEQLSAAGSLQHVKMPGADRFDCRLDRHYHLVCKKCGAVLDAPVEYQDELDRQIAQKCGFVVTRHRTIFEGLCPECAKHSRDAAES